MKQLYLQKVKSLDYTTIFSHSVQGAVDFEPAVHWHGKQDSIPYDVVHERQRRIVIR